MKNKKTVAELQAIKKTLEQDLVAAKAGSTDASKAKAETVAAKLEACEAQIETAELEAKESSKLAADADTAIAAMESAGELNCQGAAAAQRKTELRAMFTNPDSGRVAMDQIAGTALKKQQAASLNAGGSTGSARKDAALVAGRVAPVAGALTAVDGRINKFGTELYASYGYEMSAGFSVQEALAGYFELQAANSKLPYSKEMTSESQRKTALAVEAAGWYKKHLAPHLDAWNDIPAYAMGQIVTGNKALNAADYATGTLGTLTGTLVLQRALPNFAFEYPELLSMCTDFSDTPGLYNQTETTRIVQQLSAQKYDATTDATGLPKGWAATGVTGTTVDALITLTDYIGVPILVTNAVLAATARRLFDEQAFLAVKTIAAYLMQMASNLMTTANYNAYAVAGQNVTVAAAGGNIANAGNVPIAYPSYTVNSGSFALSDLDTIHAAFSNLKVPKDGRAVMLNPTFYAKLRSDPRFYFLFMGAAKSVGAPGDFLGEPMLPRISGFAPYESPYLPTSTPATNPTTQNVAGFAFQKAGMILKSRLPVDFTQSVNSMTPGSVTTITDPDTKISIMLVQFVDLTRNFAQWRPEVILGAGVGDPRGGLVLTGN